MTRSEDLKAALLRDPAILRVDNCPGAPVEISKAIYGVAQDDGEGLAITAQTDDGVLTRLLAFSGSPDDVTMWHFATEPAVHHFVVIPLSNNSPRQWRYLVLMAFEGQYTMGQYVESTCGLSAGYDDTRTLGDIMVMLRAILNRQAAWGEYFQNGVNASVTKILCYQYKTIAIKTALKNIAKRGG